MGFRAMVPAVVDPPCRAGRGSLDRRRFLSAFTLLAAGGLVEGCGPAVFVTLPIADNLPSKPPVISVPGAPAPGTGPGPGTSPLTASVTVLSGSKGSIGTEFCGLAYEKSKLTTPFFTSTNKPLISLLRLLGPGVLSIGGSSVDRVSWNDAGLGGHFGVVAPPDIDELAAFLREAGWYVLYGLNLAQSQPQTAADEASFAAHILGDRLLAINIGNEPDSYPGTYMPSAWGYPDFSTLWQNFADAVRTSLPGIAVAGPATAANDTWFDLFSSAHASSLTLLNHHYYRGNGAGATSTTSHLIKCPDPDLISMLENVVASAGRAQLPLRIAETNSFYNGGRQGVSDSYASALWVIDQSFTLARYGVQGFNLQGGGKGAYTPIEDDGKQVSAVRPEFYGLLLFALAGQGNLALLQTDFAGFNISAYVVRSVGGGLRVVIVNKDLRVVRFTIDLGFVAQNATALKMSNTSLESLSGTQIGEVSLLADGHFSESPVWRPIALLPPSNTRANSMIELDVTPISALLIQVD